MREAIQEGAFADDSEAFSTIGRALLVSKTSRLGSLACNAFVVPAKATSLHLTQPLSLGASILLAGLLKHNDSLTQK